MLNFNYTRIYNVIFVITYHFFVYLYKIYKIYNAIRVKTENHANKIYRRKHSFI